MEEMAALSSTPWQGKVKLWINRVRENKGAKFQQWDKVAEGDKGFIEVLFIGFAGLTDSVLHWGNCSVMASRWQPFLILPDTEVFWEIDLT